MEMNMNTEEAQTGVLQIERKDTEKTVEVEQEEQVIGQNGPMKSIATKESQHFMDPDKIQEMCKEYHWWIRGLCTGVKCRICGVTDQLYENEHTWQDGCRGRICKVCATRERYKDHFWVKGRCKGWRCMNCQKKKGQYRDDHEFSVPAKCQGMKCAFCNKKQNLDVLDKHEIIPGICSGFRCKNCTTQTSDDFRDVHYIVKGGCRGFKCINCNYQSKDYQEECELTVPGKCRGFKCRHCGLTGTKNFRDTHKMIEGKCKGKRCKYCDKKTSDVFLDEHEIIPGMCSGSRCANCDKMTSLDFRNDHQIIMFGMPNERCQYCKKKKDQLPEIEINITQSHKLPKIPRNDYQTLSKSEKPGKMMPPKVPSYNSRRTLLNSKINTHRISRQTAGQVATSVPKSRSSLSSKNMEFRFSQRTTPQRAVIIRSNVRLKVKHQVKNRYKSFVKQNEQIAENVRTYRSFRPQSAPKSRLQLGLEMQSVQLKKNLDPSRRLKKSAKGTEKAPLIVQSHPVSGLMSNDLNMAHYNSEHQALMESNELQDEQALNIDIEHSQVGLQKQQQEEQLSPLQPPAIIEQPIRMEESKKNSYVIPISSEGSEKNNYNLPKDDNEEEQAQRAAVAQSYSIPLDDENEQQNYPIQKTSELHSNADQALYGREDDQYSNQEQVEVPRNQQQQLPSGADRYQLPVEDDDEVSQEEQDQRSSMLDSDYQRNQQNNGGGFVLPNDDEDEEEVDNIYTTQRPSNNQVFQTEDQQFKSLRQSNINQHDDEDSENEYQQLQRQPDKYDQMFGQQENELENLVSLTKVAGLAQLQQQNQQNDDDEEDDEQIGDRGNVISDQYSDVDQEQQEQENEPLQQQMEQHEQEQSQPQQHQEQQWEEEDDEDNYSDEQMYSPQQQQEQQKLVQQPQIENEVISDNYEDDQDMQMLDDNYEEQSDRQPVQDIDFSSPPLESPEQEQKTDTTPISSSKKIRGLRGAVQEVRDLEESGQGMFTASKDQIDPMITPVQQTTQKLDQAPNQLQESPGLKQEQQQQVEIVKEQQKVDEQLPDPQEEDVYQSSDDYSL